MEKPIAPIPAFYACYLLRSIVRHSSLYIGSTPNPPRRLSQHNGETKGGAARTARDSLRPWEITCLITGFPSKIAALQFEWAWQNPNLTRHIAPDSRITHSKTTSRVSPRTGKIRKRSARPRLSLTDRLANLHLLLCAKSFSRWPLKLTFFAEDVYRVWQRRTSQTIDRLRPDISVTMDESSRGLTSVPESGDASNVKKANGIHVLDLGYARYKDQLTKSQAALDSDPAPRCNVCYQRVPATGAATLLCTNSNCDAVSHMQCLSSTFLQAEERQNALLPTQGSCSRCGTQLDWVRLVKELSLRMRGEKEIEALFKPKRVRKNTVAAVVAEYSDSSSAEEDELLNMVLDDGLDDWHELSESSDDDTEPKRTCSDQNPGYTVFKTAKRIEPLLEPIVEDSDWENAEILH